MGDHSVCQICGQEYQPDWYADDDEWRAAFPEGDIRWCCPNCFLRAASHTGVTPSGGWRLSNGDPSVEEQRYAAVAFEEAAKSVREALSLNPRPSEQLIHAVNAVAGFLERKAVRLRGREDPSNSVRLPGGRVSGTHRRDDRGRR